MIPQRWTDELEALATTRVKQSQKDYVPAEGEQIITDEVIDAWGKETLTESDLSEIVAVARGEYRLDDTREFVTEQEFTCERYNCWMVRGAEGAPSYISEPPPSPNSPAPV